MDMTVTAWENNLTATNRSDQAALQLYSAGIILDILTIIVSLVGLAGNAVVLWLLGFRMPSNAFSVYILNLAGADFLYLCGLITNFLLPFIKLDFIFKVQEFLSLVLVSVYISGLSILSAISTERCMSVMWPIWYRCHRPTHMSSIMCALLWALSLLLSGLKGYYCGILKWRVPLVWCPVLHYITGAWLILLCVLLSGSSLALMTRLLCGSQRVPPTRLYMIVVITVLVFLLCGLPIGIQNFLIIWISNEYYFLPHRYIILLCLSCVNSCVNPIIYFFVGSFRKRWWKQRHTLRLVLQRALQDTPEVDEPRESLPGEALGMSESSLGQ